MKMKTDLKENKGAVTIVEAAFVFPVVFFIVFFMIMAGEGYYQRARVEHAVTQAAIDGAARCENPMLGQVISRKSVPTDPTATDVMPYRYIFTGEAKSIASQVKGELQGKIRAMQPLLFKNMSPSNVNITVNPKMNPLVSSFSMKCTFDVSFPIRMIFSNEEVKFSYSVSITAPVGDPAELVRNVLIVENIVQRSKAISEMCGEIKGCMAKIGQWVN